jgi:hypothetical protein
MTDVRLPPFKGIGFARLVAGKFQKSNRLRLPRGGTRGSGRELDSLKSSAFHGGLFRTLPNWGVRTGAAPGLRD